MWCYSVVVSGRFLIWVNLNVLEFSSLRVVLCIIWVKFGYSVSVSVSVGSSMWFSLLCLVMGS